MSRLPEPRREHRRLSPQVARAASVQRQTELAIFEHNMDARFVAECERIDSQALGDVTKTALDEELGLLDWGTEQAAGSAAKAELVSRKVNMQSKINSVRIARRFGV
jgi:hypothetical protein